MITLILVAMFKERIWGSTALYDQIAIKFPQII